MITNGKRKKQVRRKILRDPEGLKTQNQGMVHQKV